MERFVCLLGFLFLWGPADGGDPSILTVPVSEGGEAILPCVISSRENIEKLVFDWQKVEGAGLKKKEVFFYDAGPNYNDGREGQDEQFRKRVFHFPDQLRNGNASIKIQKTKMADSGVYTCTFPLKQVSQIRLAVGAAPEPYTKILGETDSGVDVRCSVKGAFPKPEVHWQDRAGNIMAAEEAQVSERGGSYDIILQTTVTKTDHYQCVVIQEEIKHRVYTETYVIVPGSGAAPRPITRILSSTASEVHVQCEVLGAFPKPEVHWQDRAGNIMAAEEAQVSERGGSYDIILQTTVTKTDHYQCVVIQEEIKHRVYTETYVIVPLATASGLTENYSGNVVVAAIVAAVVVTLLVGAAVLFMLVKTGRIICNKDQSSKSKVPSEESGLQDPDLDI